MDRAHKQLASLCDSLIFLGILVRVAFFANVFIVSDQKSEAGNVKYRYELHARSGLRFIIRAHEDVLIVPTRALV